MSESTATWKLWGNAVPLLPVRFDMQTLAEDQQELMLSPDTWDGYRHERNDLMAFLQKRVPNLVSLSGDNHMHFAGQLMLDFDADKLVPVGSEFAVGGISSSSMYSLLTLMVDESFEPFVRYDSRPFGGDEAEVELLNMTLLDGVRAALATGSTGDLIYGEESSNPGHARHLRYVESNGYGYGLVTVSGEGVDLRYVSTEAPVEEADSDGVPVRRVVRFHVPVAKEGEAPVLEGPFFEQGDPPFPFG